MNRQDQLRVRRRRTRVMGAGFAVIALASATACIFEKSDYQGGGRLDKGGEAKTADQAASSAQPTTTATPTVAKDSSTPNPPLPEAGGD